MYLVAVGVFHFGGQLGEGLAEFGQEHDGVEAKAAIAHWLARDFARHAARGDERLRVVCRAQGDEGADHRGAAVLHALHLLQQGAHVVGVAFFVAEAGGVVGGVHAGLVAKGVHTPLQNLIVE